MYPLKTQKVDDHSLPTCLNTAEKVWDKGLEHVLVRKESFMAGIDSIPYFRSKLTPQPHNRIKFVCSIRFTLRFRLRIFLDVAKTPHAQSFVFVDFNLTNICENVALKVNASMRFDSYSSLNTLFVHVVAENAGLGSSSSDLIIMVQLYRS